MARQRVYIGADPSAEPAGPGPLQPLHRSSTPSPRPSFPWGRVYAVPAAGICRPRRHRRRGVVRAAWPAARCVRPDRGHQPCDRQRPTSGCERQDSLGVGDEQAPTGRRGPEQDFAHVVSGPHHVVTRRRRRDGTSGLSADEERSGTPHTNSWWIPVGLGLEVWAACPATRPRFYRHSRHSVSRRLLRGAGKDALIQDGHQTVR